MGLSAKRAVKKTLFFHEAAQKMTGLPLAITPEEAVELNDAIDALAVYYDIDLKTLGKWGAILNMIGVSGAIYGPRLIMIAAWRAQMKQRAREEAATPVYPANTAAPAAPSFAEAAAAATNQATNGSAAPAEAGGQAGVDPMAVEGLQRAS